MAFWKPGRKRPPGVAFLAEDKAIRSNTSVCLKVVDPAIAALSDDAQADFAKKLAALLEKEGVALDIGGYRDAPAGLRIWCGATVDTADLDAPSPPGLDWAFATVAAELAAAFEATHQTSRLDPGERPECHPDLKARGNSIS